MKNPSATTCSVTGLPRGVLLDKAGKAQPTHILTAMPGAMAILATLTHGKSASATARFSPDVPGVGEPARSVRADVLLVPAVRARRRDEVVALIPPTSVCEHGQLQFRAYALVH